jgi:hypothetical protein
MHATHSLWVLAVRRCGCGHAVLLTLYLPLSLNYHCVHTLRTAQLLNPRALELLEADMMGEEKEKGHMRAEQCAGVIFYWPSRARRCDGHTVVMAAMRLPVNLNSARHGYLCACCRCTLLNPPRCAEKVSLALRFCCLHDLHHQAHTWCWILGVHCRWWALRLATGVADRYEYVVWPPCAVHSHHHPSLF